MTTPSTFERSLVDWLEDAGAPVVPDYVDEMLARTRATRQRPAWASLERWLPMQLTLRRPIVAVSRMAWLLLVLALLIALFLVTVVVTGQHHLPAPLGPARNGLIALDSNGRISVVRSDGTDERVLTTDTEVDILPFWSRDGTRIAFYSFPVRNDATPSDGAGPPLYDSPDKPIGSVVVMDADGSNRKTVATGLTIATGFVAPIAWSHDGRLIAFSYKSSAGRPTVDVLDLDGTVRFHADEASWPTWSPDDRSIAYQVPTMGVGLARIDGSTPARVISHAYGSGFAFAGPAWSPDGQRIAFFAGLDGRHDVYSIAIDGTDERSVGATAADEYWPMWSPDGTQFVFERVGDGDNDIHFVIADADGGNLRMLATPLLAGMASSWSPDGKFLVGHTFNSTAIDGVMLVDVSDPSRSTTFASSSAGFDWQRIAP
jgi:Tol biopolymer transport system component